MNAPVSAASVRLATLAHLEDKAAKDAILAAKAALTEAIRTGAFPSIAGALKADAETLGKLGLDTKQLKALTANKILLGTLAELVMRAEQKRQIKYSADEKKKDKEQKAKQHAEFDKRAPEAEPKAEEKKSLRPDDIEPDEDEVEEKKNIKDALELDDDGKPDLELEDIKEIAKDADALKNMQDVDVGKWQADLLKEIKTMPSVGDQAAWMFIVAQLNMGNMAFRNEGAAHLMQSVKNGLLSTEDQVLARAGADALRDPTNAAFAALIPHSMTPQAGAAPSIAGTIHRHKDDDEILELAVDQTNEGHAPFSLIQNGGDAITDLAERAQAVKPLLAMFRDHSDITRAPETVATPDAQYTQYAQPKAKSIFGDMNAPELKPTAAFFDAVLGKRSDS